MGKTPAISIVDDDDSVRLAMESFLRSLGFDAHTFASAREFLNSPQLDETACLITDVRMPEMSGVDLQRALLQGGHDIPVIFITAFPEETVRRQALENGAVAFMSKPFDCDAMIECLSKALGNA